MSPWVWVFRPIVYFVMVYLICAPVRMAVARFLPDNAIKRLLLRKVW